MPTTLADWGHYMQVIKELDDRLVYHCADVAGRKLEKMKYDREGRLDAEGASDLPYIQPFMFIDDEDTSAGMAPNEVNGFKFTQGNSNVAQTFTVSFWVCARRDYGFFDRNKGVAKKRGIVEWVALVRDALETKADGTNEIDSRLGGAATVPMRFSIRDNDVTDLSWSVLLEVQVETAPCYRGLRYEA